MPVPGRIRVTCDVFGRIVSNRLVLSHILARFARIQARVRGLDCIPVSVYVLGNMRILGNVYVLRRVWDGFRTRVRHLAIRDRLAVVADALLTRPALAATESTPVVTAFPVLAVGYAFHASIPHAQFRWRAIRGQRIERVVIAWCTAFIVPAVLAYIAPVPACTTLAMVAHLSIRAVTARPRPPAPVVTALLARTIGHAFHAFPLLAFFPFFAVAALAIAPVGTAFLALAIRHAFPAPAALVFAHIYTRLVPFYLAAKRVLLAHALLTGTIGTPGHVRGLAPVFWHALSCLAILLGLAFTAYTTAVVRSALLALAPALAAIPVLTYPVVTAVTTTAPASVRTAVLAIAAVRDALKIAFAGKPAGRVFHGVGIGEAKI